MKRKRGKCAKNNKSGPEPDEIVLAPHSFVIHKGLPGGHVSELTKDFRKVMEPFTASSLKERKKNSVKDFLQIAGPLHVSHLCIFSRTELGVYMKVARFPKGPTLTFKVHDFSLSRDVISSLKKQLVIERAFTHSPLIVLNSFSGEGKHLQLMASMFQNMFPSINLTTVDLNKVRRCVLMNYNPVTKLIDFRHYVIKVAPVGISKGVKKVVQGKVPNLAKCEDISEFLTKSGMLSESEVEDDPNSHVILPQKLSTRGNMEFGQSAIRLSELGPRLNLQLIKIEDGLMEGDVLYHDLIHKSEEEKEEIKKRRDAKKKLKAKRKKIQDENLKAKKAEKEELKEKSLQGMKKVQFETDKLLKQAVRESNIVAPVEEDDDAQYYREEVGEEPEKELFTARPVGQKRPASSFRDFKNKKPRFEEGGPSKFNTNKKFDPSKKFDPNRKFDPKKKFDSNRKFDPKKKFDSKNKFDSNKKFGSKNKFDRSDNKGFKKGNKGKRVDKTNSHSRDFRPIGGKGGGRGGGKSNRGGKRK